MPTELLAWERRLVASPWVLATGRPKAHAVSVKVPVYFSGSISGGRADAAYYGELISALKAAGHEVYAEHVGDPTLSGSGEKRTASEIYDRDLRWIQEVAEAGGALVAEVSSPSTGVGYEIATARFLHDMPVICLFRPAHLARCSAMIAGDSGIVLLESRLDESLETVISRLLEALESVANKSP